MNLRLKPFEERMHLRVRAELRRSPAAWKEYRRVRKRRQIQAPVWFFRVMVLLVFCTSWASSRRPTDTLVAMIILWAGATVTWRATQFLIALRTSPRLLVFAHLPVSDQEVFAFQWRGYLQVSAWSILDFTALYGVLAYRVGYGSNSLWAGLFMALVQWLTMVSLTAGLVAFVRTRILFGYAGLCAMVFAGLAVALAVSPFFASLAGSLAKLAFWIPPTGWILYALGITPQHNILFGWWPALAMSAAVFALPMLYRRLRSRYAMPVGVPTTEAVRGAVEAQRRLKSDGESPDPYADIKAAIRSRRFFTGYDWKRGGWLERLTTRWLTPEERLAAEFLSAGEPRLTLGIMKTPMVWVRFLVLACIVLFLVKTGPIILIILISSLRVLLIKSWPGTGLRNVSGSNIAMCSIYPVGFWQIARVCLKFNLQRLLTLMPFLAVVAAFGLKAHGYGAGDGTRLAGRILLFILAFQFLFPILALSAGTNDSSRQRIIWLTLVAAILLVGSCIALFFADSLVAIAAAAAVLLGGSISALLVYGHAYNHNWFDLQNKPKNTPPAQPQ